MQGMEMERHSWVPELVAPLEGVECEEWVSPGAADKTRRSRQNACEDAHEGEQKHHGLKQGLARHNNNDDH